MSVSESRLVGRCQHDSESHAGSLTPMAKVAERRKLGRRGSDRDVPVTPFPSLFLGAQGVKRAEGERRRRGRRGRAAGRRDGGTAGRGHFKCRQRRRGIRASRALVSGSPDFSISSDGRAVWGLTAARN